MLSDRDLKRRLPTIITPYDEGRVQPSSYDVELSGSFKVPERHDVLYIDLADPPSRTMKSVELEDGQKMVVHPGDFILAATRECVDVPNDMVCRLEGKSSVGRLGLLIHATAGWVDSGFSGNITLEMVNAARTAIVLRPGLLIAQLSFSMLTSEVERPYAGRYQGDRGAVESRYGRHYPNRTR